MPPDTRLTAKLVVKNVTDDKNTDENSTDFANSVTLQPTFSNGSRPSR